MKQNKKQSIFKIALSSVAIFLAIFFVFSSFSSEAAVSKNINYQGLLADSAGTAVADGTYTLHLKIYTLAGGGLPLWSTDQIVTTKNGVFSTLLDISALDFDGSTFYLGVAINSDPEMTPRKALGSVPQAINANNLIGDGMIDISGNAGIGSGTIGSGGANHNDGPLNDLSVLGGNQASLGMSYYIVISGTGAQDRFDWSDDGGATWEETNVPIPVGSYAISNEVEITFANQSGHSLGENWNFSTQAFRLSTGGGDVRFGNTDGGGLKFQDAGEGNWYIMAKDRFNESGSEFDMGQGQLGMWTYDRTRSGNGGFEMTMDRLKFGVARALDGAGALESFLYEADYSNLATAGDGYTALKINITDTADADVTNKLLMDLQNGSVSQFSIDSTGNTRLTGNLGIGNTSSFYNIFQTNQAQSSNLTYTLPTGYAPFSGYVLSSTAGGVMSWVANDGVSQWTTNGGDIYFNTGNVGIGTTAPVNDLSVIGDAYFSGNIGIGTTADAAFALKINNGETYLGSGGNGYLKTRNGGSGDFYLEQKNQADQTLSEIDFNLAGEGIGIWSYDKVNGAGDGNIGINIRGAGSGEAIGQRQIYFSHNSPVNGTGVNESFLFEPDYSSLASAGDGYTALKVNVYADAQAGALGARNLLDLQVGSVSKFAVDSGGNATFSGDINVLGSIFQDGASHWKTIGDNVYLNAPLIPPMTSDTSPSGVASASSTYNSDIKAWHAFKKSHVSGDTDMWASADGVSTGWLRYQFPSAQVINSYSFFPQNNGYGTLAAPNSWTFEGSNDGSSWTILDTQVGVSSWVLGSEKLFPFVNSNQYLYYRINVSSVNGGSYIGISDLRMFNNENASGTLVIPGNDASVQKLLIGADVPYFPNADLVYMEESLPDQLMVTLRNTYSGIRPAGAQFTVVDDVGNTGGLGISNSNWPMLGDGVSPGEVFVASYGNTDSNLVLLTQNESAHIRFSVNKQERMRVDSTGNVGIGSISPDTTLKVVGSICAKATDSACFGTTAGTVYADNFIAGGTALNIPDYVFEDNYNLMPLSQLADYISTNKHLPGIPSAEEVNKTGLNLVQMVPAILEKTEENTLYILGLNLKTDQNINTLGELQSSIDEQLGVIESGIKNQESRIDEADKVLKQVSADVKTLADKQSANDNLIAILQTQILELQNKLNTETNLAQIDLNTQDMTFVKLLLGVDRVKNPEDVDILGKLSSKILSTGGIEVILIDPEAPTIGEGTVASDKDMEFVETKAVTKNSKIYLTPVGSTDNQVLYVGAIDEAKGFEVKVDRLETILTPKGIKFDWWIVETK